MSRMVYLLNMTISGIKNLEKDIYIDFYGKQIDKRFNPEKYKIKAIYGENGTGKTAIISAVEIVKEFIINENYLRDFDNQALLKDLINKKTKTFVFRCEYVTLIESIFIFEYEVHFSFDENDEVYVSYESLKYKSNNSKCTQMTIFVCQNGDFVVLDANVNDRNRILDITKNLTSKQSVLSLLFKMVNSDYKVFIDRLIIVYATIFFLVIFTHFGDEDKHTKYYQNIRLNELKRNNLVNKSVVDELLQNISTNERRVAIDEFDHYLKNIKGLERFIKLFKPSLNSIVIDKREDNGYYICRILFDYIQYTVDFEFESTGIKHLVDIYSALKMASLGAVVFIDELDANINDVMLGKLVEYFVLYCNGQLCFTSHNTTPMIVLKRNNKSIDYLTTDNKIISWVKNGNYSPENRYRDGMIEGLPFNVDPSDFISVFEENI